MSKIKICFLVSSFNGGGAEKQVVLLLNKLQEYHELDLQLIYFEEGVHFKNIKMNNISIIKINSTSYYNPINIIKISKIIKSQKPDVIFSWLSIMDIYAYFIKKMHKKIKWIVAERNSDYLSTFRDNLRNKLVKFADMIIANSDKGKEFWLNRGIPAEKIIVSYNILSVKEPDLNFKLEGNPAILYVGRFSKQKNIEFLCKAFCEIAISLPSANFYLIGKGVLENELRKCIDEHNKNNSVIILPFQENIQDYFSAADLFISVSHYEGMPNTVMESVTLNTTPIVSNIKEHTDILGDNYPFLLKKLDSHVELKTLILQALKNTKNDELLRYAQSKLNKMSAENVSQIYLKCFKKITTQRNLN